MGDSGPDLAHAPITGCDTGLIEGSLIPSTEVGPRGPVVVNARAFLGLKREFGGRGPVGIVGRVLDRPQRAPTVPGISTINAEQTTRNVFLPSAIGPGGS